MAGLEGLTPRKRKTVDDAPVKQSQPRVETKEELAKESTGSFFESQIAKMLGYSTFEPERRYWLRRRTGLNATLGSRELGLPYGKIYELSGVEHGGKTTLATYIAGLAQKDGAGVGYIDLEDSRDEVWATKMGLDMSRVIQVYPKLVTPGTRKKKKKSGRGFGADEDEEKKVKPVGPMLQSGEDMFAEAEAGMALLHKHGFKKQFWFLDSIANLQMEMVLEAGANGQNMRTKLERSAFLSQTLPTWAGLAANYNAMIFLLNQLRDKQGMVFGKRTYSTGGRALRHGCSIRVEVLQRKGGKAKLNGRTIGIIGRLANEKNKAGGGSVPYLKCDFKVITTKTPARVSFLAVEDE